MIQVFSGGLSQHLFTEKREEVVGPLHPQHTVITSAKNTCIYFIIVQGECVDERIHKGLSKKSIKSNYI